ncbi:MAG: hypothetical protein ACREHD_27760 [Pirellulales bacterium]
MESPNRSDRVIGLLRQRTVATFAALAKQLRVSRRTVRRALKRHGYFSSCNQNGAYVTLRETPDFTPEGLWRHRKACFSSHGTLLQTIRALVEASRAGKTVAELEEQLQTRVHNQLSWLLEQAELKRGSVGRRAVYLSHDSARAAAQQQQRQQQPAAEPTAATSRAAPSRRCPEGMNAEAVIRVLVQMIDTPKASPASLAQKLRSQGLAVQAQQVRRLIEFYSLEKKTEP